MRVLSKIIRKNGPTDVDYILYLKKVCKSIDSPYCFGCPIQNRNGKCSAALTLDNFQIVPYPELWVTGNMGKLDKSIHGQEAINWISNILQHCVFKLKSVLPAPELEKRCKKCPLYKVACYIE